MFPIWSAVIKLLENVASIDIGLKGFEGGKPSEYLDIYTLSRVN